MSEETFDARMERLLRTLPPALRGMGFGDPDDFEYAHASDVVAWAIREIDRLRKDNDEQCRLHGIGSQREARQLAIIEEKSREVDRLREERRSISTLLQKVESLEAEIAHRDREYYWDGGYLPKDL
jgi:hypothetical protein